MPSSKPEETYRKILDKVDANNILYINGIKFSDVNIQTIRTNQKIIIKCVQNLDKCLGSREILIKSLLNKNIKFYGCLKCTNKLYTLDENGEFRLNNKNVQNKSQQTRKTEEFKNKMSNIQRLESTNEKKRKTYRKKYGDNYKIVIRKKIDETNNKKYGNKFYLHSDKWKNKAIGKYGTANLMSLDYYKDKIRETCNKKYNCNNVMQVMEIWDKKNTTSLAKYEYQFPSGFKIYIQGYENIAIDLLLSNGYKEEDILAGEKLEKRIKYTFYGKEHMYFPDIYIPSEDKFIEIKSAWTYNPNSRKRKLGEEYLKILAKEIAVREEGYNFEIWIFDKNKKLMDREILDNQIQNEILEYYSEDEINKIIDYV
jgi:hypothetical protein